MATAITPIRVVARRFTWRLDRARLVDLAVVAVTMTIGFAFLAAVVVETHPPPDEVVLQGVIGVLATLLLWWRRRWPLTVAVLMVPLSFLSAMVQIAGLVAVFSVAVARRAAVAGTAAVAFWLPTLLLHGIESDSGLAYLAAVLFSATLVAAAMGWGMFVRARCQLLASLRERAQRAEAEQHVRVGRAQQAERTRIAREMHDVLGHRLSLLGMHAGALEYRPDASPAELAAAAGTVREQARLALRDLREIVGVLRDEGDEPTTPQPTLADLAALVAESTSAGMRVDAHVDVADEPNPTGRHAYRIVQEALTNARRHAPGELVVLRVEGDASRGISIMTTNPVNGVSRGDDAASGLVGMAERARLVGGRLEHGTTDDGRYTLTAWALVDMSADVTGRIRVVIADDDPLVRSALLMVLSGHDDITVVGEAADGDEVPDAVSEHHPDVVLMDIRMPRLDGVRATEVVRARPGAPDIIVLTTFDADDHVLGALRAGASGFLLKDTPPADIVDAVRRVAAGEPILSAAVTRQLIALATNDRIATPATTMMRDQLGRLSDREREVAEAVSRGLSNAEIAAELYMSVATVKSYVTRLLTKLELTNRVQIAILMNHPR